MVLRTRAARDAARRVCAAFLLPSAQSAREHFGRVAQSLDEHEQQVGRRVRATEETLAAAQNALHLHADGDHGLLLVHVG